MGCVETVMEITVWWGVPGSSSLPGGRTNSKTDGKGRGETDKRGLKWFLLSDSSLRHDDNHQHNIQEKVTNSKKMKDIYDVMR